MVDAFKVGHYRFLDRAPSNSLSSLISLHLLLAILLAKVFTLPFLFIHAYLIDFV